VTLAVLALVVGVLGVAGLSHAETGIVRIVIPGALSAPTGTSADGQVTLRIGVGLSVFEVNAAGMVIGGPIATVTFAQWSDTVLTPDIGPQSTLMVFRLPDGLMVIAAGVGTPNGVATTFSATAPYQALTGQWEMTTGSTPAEALVTFAYDTNSHIKQKAFLQFVAGDALTSVATKTIPGVASVNALRNVPFFEVVNHAKGASLGVLAGHSAHDIAGHASEVIELRTIRLRNANLYLLYGCAAPNPTSGVGCLVGGTGFSTHLSGPVGQIPGATAKAAISGVADSDLVVEMQAENP
jgi:hypothetical protein